MCIQLYMVIHFLDGLEADGPVELAEETQQGNKFIDDV